MTEPTFLIADDLGTSRALLVTRSDLEEANDPETMEEVDTLAVGERRVIGQCDEIERVS